MDDTEKFYSDAVTYWSRIPPTIEGMLGGYGHVSEIDIRGSKLLLQQLFKCKTPPGRQYALDCGAGIGRITKHLLLNNFETVDLIEQNSEFLEKAREYIGPKLLTKVGDFYAVGLQNFVPESNKYDVIWVQWVLGHLTDIHLLQFLKNCKNGLKPGGMIVVKENITTSGDVEIDQRDSSVTRPLSLLKKIFMDANLECYRQLKQTSFPKELYSVYMFALKCEAVMADSELANDILITNERYENIEQTNCEASSIAVMPDSESTNDVLVRNENCEDTERSKSENNIVTVIHDSEVVNDLEIQKKSCETIDRTSSEDRSSILNHVDLIIGKEVI